MQNFFAGVCFLLIAVFGVLVRNELKGIREELKEINQLKMDEIMDEIKAEKK